MKKIALVPVYNEESMILPLVDLLVIVDDGSLYGSRVVVTEMGGRP
jgi:hypothetical protein